VKLSFGRRLAVIGLSAVLTPAAARAAQVTLTGDAHVNAARPSTNFGSLANLYVGSGNVTLLQYDLTSLPAGTTSSQIARASLTLFVNRITTPGTVSLSTATSAWTESAVTSASAPSIGGQVATITPGVSGTYITYDVTAVVQNWITTPAGNFGFALQSANGLILFDSKENDETGHAPALDITITSQGAVGPIGPQGIQGIQGPQGPLGPQGPQGSQGPQGIQGIQGVPGATGAVGIIYRNAWSGATAYNANDVVSYNSASYIALKASTNVTPDSDPTSWSVLAAQGAQGIQGIQGVPGTPGTNGTNGTPGINGTNGTNGTPGAPGTAGTNGTNGSNGPAGPQGPAGPSSSFASFTVAAGAQVSVANTVYFSSGNSVATPAIGAAGTSTVPVVGISTQSAIAGAAATIQLSGVVQCYFDNTGFSGNYVVASTTTAGLCHAVATYPTGVQVLGILLSSSTAGTNSAIYLMGPESYVSETSGGGSVPNGTAANQLYVTGAPPFSATNPVTTLPTSAEPAHTGDVTNSAGSTALSIANNATAGNNIVAAVNTGSGTISASHLGSGSGSAATYLNGAGAFTAPASGSGGTTYYFAFENGAVSPFYAAPFYAAQPSPGTLTTNDLIFVPAACTLQDLNVIAYTSSAGSPVNLTATIYKNGSLSGINFAASSIGATQTPVTCSLTESAVQGQKASCPPTTGTAPLAAGDNFFLQLTETNAGNDPYTRFAATVSCQ
jgi:hypothetical protein